MGSDPGDVYRNLNECEYLGLGRRCRVQIPVCTVRSLESHSPQEKNAGEVGRVGGREVASHFPVVDDSEQRKHELVEDSPQQKYPVLVVVLQSVRIAQYEFYLSMLCESIVLQYFKSFTNVTH